MPWLSTYGYRKQITISKTNVGSDLTDFPSLVAFASDTDIGGHMQDLTNYYDIRFTSSDGTTLLKYEKESMVITTGSATGNYWVKVPTITTAANTVIYVYYGKASDTDGSDATNVWDSNYKAVWHLKETGTNPTVYDSTSNAHNSTSQTWTPTTSGKVDGAGTFNGSSNSIIVTDSSDFQSSAIRTVSAWFTRSALTGVTFPTILNEYKDANNSWRINVVAHDNVGDEPDTLYYSAIVSGTTFYKNTSILLDQVDTWYNVAVDVNGTTINAIYINGVNVAKAGTSAQGQGNTNELVIGSRADNLRFWNGKLDEVRISNTARSADWIKFEYHNQADSGNNLTYGTEETNGGTVNIGLLMMF